MSVQQTPLPKRRRKFWFIPRFSMRTFFVASILIGAVLGPYLHRTRQQMRIFDAINEDPDNNMHCWLEVTPRWLRFLPQNLLDAADGHWCRSVGQISLNYNAFDANPFEQPKPKTEAEVRASCRRNLELAAQLPSVQTLDIDLESMPGDLHQLTETMSPLAHFNGLKEIAINVGTPNPRLLEALPKLPQLTSLTLDTDYANRLAIPLRELLKFPKLEYLSFANLCVEDNDLSPLVELTHLQHVSAQNLVVTASEMECLAGHPTLENIDITPYAYTDDIFKILASIPNLNNIDAAQSLITDQGLSYLAHARHLKTLVLVDATITDEGFAKLCNCKSLQNIECLNCKLSDAVGPALAQLPNLQKIDLRGTLTTSKLLDHLTGNKTLHQNVKNIQVGDPRISLDQLLGFFDDATEYSAYEVWSCASYLFGDMAHGKITENKVDLSRIQGVRGRFGYLDSSNRIADLNLRDTDIDDSDLKVLSPLLQDPILDISNTNCTAAGIAHLAQNSAPVALTLGPMDNQQETLNAISQMLSLEALALRGRWPLANEARSSLLSMMGLESLTMEDCEIDEAFAMELCQLPQLSGIKCKNLDWDNAQIEALRTSCSPAGSAVPSIRYEADLDCLSGRSISSLNATGIALSPSAIAKISQMKGICKLNLSETGITDSQLAALTALANLEELDLSGNPVTDAAISTLARLNELGDLRLADTRLTNKGLSQIMTSMSLSLVDISGTATDDKAWDGITFRAFSSMVCGNLPDLPNILTRVPIDLLPNSMYIGRENFEITVEEIETMRGSNQEFMHGNLMFAPETVNVWPPEKMLAGKDRQLTLSICGTSQLNTILNHADKHYISDVKIVSEHLNTSGIADFPKTTRNVTLQDCIVDTKTIRSLAKCQWLRSIQFDSCDLKDCDFEVLLTMPMLCEFSTGNCKLSSAQQAVLQQLRPRLIEREQMAYLRFIGPYATGLVRF